MKAFSLFVNDTQRNTRCSGFIQYMEKQKDDCCGHFECENWKQDYCSHSVKKIISSKENGRSTIYWLSRSYCLQIALRRNGRRKLKSATHRPISTVRFSMHL